MPVPRNEDVRAQAERLVADAWSAARQAPPRRLGRIVLAVDGSEGCEHAIAWAQHLAPAWAGVMVVVPPAAGPDAYGVPGAAGWQDAATREAERVAADTASRLRAPGREVEAATRFGVPAREIEQFAQERAAELVVVGAHGGGAVSRLVMGSVTDGLLRQARRSVLVARAPPPARRVLLPVDGSPAGTAAAALGAGLARAWGEPATVLHVVAPPWLRGTPDQRRALRDALAAGLPAPEPGLDAAVDVGSAAERIVAHARERGCDLVVLGAHGATGLRGALGSVSHRVAHHAGASVLVAGSAWGEAGREEPARAAAQRRGG